MGKRTKERDGKKLTSCNIRDKKRNNYLTQIIFLDHGYSIQTN